MGRETIEIDIETFIARWSQSSGAERANFQMFAIELCQLLGWLRRSPHGESKPS